MVLLLAQALNWWQVADSPRSDEALFRTSCDMDFDRVQSVRIHSSWPMSSDAHIVYKNGEVTTKISRAFAELLATRFSKDAEGVLAPAMGWFMAELSDIPEEAWPIDLESIGPGKAEVDEAFREWQSRGEPATSYPESRAYQLFMWRNIGYIMVDWALANDAAHIEVAGQHVGTYVRIAYSGPVEDGFQPYSAASFTLDGREIGTECSARPVQ